MRVRQHASPIRTVWAGDQPNADRPTALIQALPEWPRDTVVAVPDSMLNRSLITPDELLEVRRAVRGRRGAASLHSWWPLVDGRAQSPLETGARLQCFDAGLPAPSLQVAIGLDNAGIARGDLGWRRSDGTCVLVEIDGREFHDNPEAVFHDRRRQNSIALAGRHTLLRFTGRDLAQRTLTPTVIRSLPMGRPREQHQACSESVFQAQPCSRLATQAEPSVSRAGELPGRSQGQGSRPVTREG